MILKVENLGDNIKGRMNRGRKKMEMNLAMEKFEKIIEEKRMVDTAITSLHWDLETQAPKKGMELLSGVVGYLSSKSYELATGRELVEAVDALNGYKGELDPVKVKIVEEVEREIDKIKKIPAVEYSRYNELTARAQGIWAEAREKSDFKIFEGPLKEIVEYQRKFTGYRGWEGHPYNTLLDDYEPGMTVEKLDDFFGYLRGELVPFLKKIEAEGRDVRKDFLEKSYPIVEQRDFSRELAEYIGFDFDRGIISESAHPFTLNYDRNDVRLTTRYEEKWFSSSVFGTIHEGGHGLYEQGIGEEIASTVLGTGTSMGIHESQSRFYENMLGRSKAFWKPLYEGMKGRFGALKDVGLDEFYRGINRSEASLIRVEADELTYSLHIMVRYEIEKMLIEGSIEVEDLPGVWNDKMEEYLGIRPSKDSEGVLQDVHWSCGLFGYFPSYALGNAYAAQIYNTMEGEIDIEKNLDERNLAVIKEWLGENIHRWGKGKKPAEIIVDISGEELNAKYFIDYLKEKYSRIYL